MKSGSCGPLRRGRQLHVPQTNARPFRSGKPTKGVAPAQSGMAKRGVKKSAGQSASSELGGPVQAGPAPGILGVAICDMQVIFFDTQIPTRGLSPRFYKDSVHPLKLWWTLLGDPPGWYLNAFLFHYDESKRYCNSFSPSSQPFPPSFAPCAQQSGASSPRTQRGIPRFQTPQRRGNRPPLKERPEWHGMSSSTRQPYMAIATL